MYPISTSCTAKQQGLIHLSRNFNNWQAKSTAWLGAWSFSFQLSHFRISIHISISINLKQFVVFFLFLFLFLFLFFVSSLFRLLRGNSFNHFEPLQRGLKRPKPHTYCTIALRDQKFSVTQWTLLQYTQWPT